MKYGINTMDDIDYEGKTVLCRVDLNSPLKQPQGELADDTRIRRSLPTIRELSETGAKTVLLTHQGGDLEYKNYRSTEPHSRIFSELLQKPVTYIDDICGPAARDSISSLRDGDILLLDNVRFLAEELTLFETKLNLNFEDQAKTLLVRVLAPLADYFVCDAFAAAHRSQPSLAGFPLVLPSQMGRLFEEEYSILSGILQEPKRPCTYVFGGAKIQDAFLILPAVLQSGAADLVLTCGLVGHIMLMAKDIRLGAASESFIYKNSLGEYIQTAKELLCEYGAKILLPQDIAWEQDGVRMEGELKAAPQDKLIGDIGSQTIAVYEKIIEDSGTIFINGPAGVFEQAATELGTKSLWQAIAKSGAFSILGGGDSITAVNKFGLYECFSYVSSAGGSLVRFLSGEELPVIKALRLSAEKYGQGR
ncbi:MAG: phosphoglycerate kinase [Gracilibacteraceae bacterium]|jgi:phosphoglycerate kinase|nr:phosphoglycerate kinase [Gracilibacteraceae bacterium]